VTEVRVVFRQLVPAHRSVTATEQRDKTTRELLIWAVRLSVENVEKALKATSLAITTDTIRVRVMTGASEQYLHQE